MKFLQVTAVYEGYLREFFRTCPASPNATWRTSVDSLLQGGFSASHVVAPHLNQLGWDACTIVTNDGRSQALWLQEQGFDPSLLSRPDNLVRIQIERMKPDVLYFQDPITYDSTFIRGLSFRPRLVFGWRAAAIPESTDFSAFDLMLTNSSYCRRTMLAQGARRVERHHPGFPVELYARCGDVQPTWDLVFSGQWTAEHKARNALLLELSKAQLRCPHTFTLAYFLSTNGRHPMPAGVAMHDQGPRWGLEMYKALRLGRATLHHPIDLSETEAPAMRLFEATGMGVPLFVQETPGIREYFEPNEEVITYRDASELVEKLVYFLKAPTELAALGKRGQARCFRDHSMEVRAKALDSVLRASLGSESPRHAPGQQRKTGLSAPSSSKTNPNLVSWQQDCAVTVGEQSDVQAVTIAFDRPGAEVEIGARTFIGRSLIVSAESVSIGSDVLISWGCTITDHDSHSTDFRLRRNDVVDWLSGNKDWTHVRRSPVRICDKVWMGFNTIVLKGVTIGEGAVVAAGSVVTRDVPPWTMVAGNPARIVKEVPRPES